MATNPLFWAAWHSPDSKTARREQRSLLLLMALSFWIHPGHALFLSRCQALLCVQMVTEVTARGLSSPLSPPGSQFYPYLSNMDILPWCQLRMKLEQLALPQLLPRAGLPWDEELSLDILSSYTSSLVPSHHLILVLVQAVHVQDSFPSLFWYSCMSCSGAFPLSLSPSMQWVRAGSCGWGDRRSSLQPPSALGF